MAKIFEYEFVDHAQLRLAGQEIMSDSFYGLMIDVDESVHAAHFVFTDSILEHS